MTLTSRLPRLPKLERASLLLLTGCLSAACGGTDTSLDSREAPQDGAGTLVEPELQAMLEENQALVAALDARGRAEYSDERARELLETSGLTLPTYEGLLAAEQRLREAPLALEEERAIQSAFAGRTPREELSIEGRLVQWGDLLFSADELLARGAEGASVDKAQICTTGRGGCVDNDSTPFAIIDADGSADTLPFRRPDVFTSTFMVVADAAPAFFFNALVAETSKIENLNPPGDCLGNSAMAVLRQTTFNQLSAGARAGAYSMAVSYTAGACGGALGCAGLPSFKSVVVGGVSVSRVALGKTTFALNSSRLPNDDADFRSTLLHELGHMLGRAHPESDGSAGLIPGTSRQLTVSSVMCAPDAACASDDLSVDDILAVETLYSDSPNRDNDDCAYNPDYRVLTPL